MTNRIRPGHSSRIAVAFLALSATTPACSCFVAGIRIRTPDGLRPIEDLRVGDVVFAFDHVTLRLVTVAVSGVRSAEAKQFVRVRTEDGRAISRVTGSHPFYSVTTGSYVPAHELCVGDVLVGWTDHGDPSKSVIAELEVVEEDEPVPVYNLHVDGPECYFAEDLLVHNKSLSDDDDDSDYGMDDDDSAMRSSVEGDEQPVQEESEPNREASFEE